MNFSRRLAYFLCTFASIVRTFSFVTWLACCFGLASSQWWACFCSLLKLLHLDGQEYAYIPHLVVFIYFVLFFLFPICPLLRPLLNLLFLILSSDIYIPRICDKPTSQLNLHPLYYICRDVWDTARYSTFLSSFNHHQKARGLTSSIPLPSSLCSFTTIRDLVSMCLSFLYWAFSELLWSITLPYFCMFLFAWIVFSFSLPTLYLSNNPLLYSITLLLLYLPSHYLFPSLQCTIYRQSRGLVT